MKADKLQIRIEPERKEQWKALAQGEGLSLSEFIIQKVEENIHINYLKERK